MPDNKEPVLNLRLDDGRVVRYRRLCLQVEERREVTNEPLRLRAIKNEDVEVVEVTAESQFVIVWVDENDFRLTLGELDSV